jgi:hypothetical protein
LLTIECRRVLNTCVVDIVQSHRDTYISGVRS